MYECKGCGGTLTCWCPPPHTNIRSQGDEQLHFICKEWLRSCSDAHEDRPWECEPCTDEFKKVLYAHLKKEMES